MVGESESGDQYVVRPFPGGALIAVVDGLGHGRGAHDAAREVVATLEEHAQEPVALLLKRCHKEMAGSRGVVMSLAAFGVNDTMTWVGVGNVRGLLLYADRTTERMREWLMLRGGVVGYRMPTLHPAVISVSPGDTLIFVTDGIRSKFTDELSSGNPLQPPAINHWNRRWGVQQIADDILEQHGREADDALVLVARYGGKAEPARP